MKPKARYSKPGYRTLKHKWFGYVNFHHVMNLFEAHRWEREHPATIVQTSRYREWAAKRDSVVLGR
jgi:hypothetical protein